MRRIIKHYLILVLVPFVIFCFAFLLVKNFLYLFQPASLIVLPSSQQALSGNDYCASGSCGEPSAARIYNLAFDTDPANADYAMVFGDGSEKKGKTPFSGPVPSGQVKVAISYKGYNPSNVEFLLDKDTQKFFYLDRSGQLVHRLLNIEAVPSPKALAFSPDGKELWSTMLLNKKRGLGVYSVDTGADLADINLDDGGGVELVFSSDGSKVYVSQMETARVYEIDAKTKKILRTFDTKSAWTKVVALSHDGKSLYAANWSGNDVSIINLENGTVSRIPTVKTPRGLYATRDNKTLYVAGFGAGEIEKIDLKSKKGIVIYKSGGAMRHLAVDEDRGVMYVSDMGRNAIFEVDLANDSVKKFADTDYDPNTIALSPDKKILYVSCRGRNAANDNYYIPGPEWGSVLLFDTKNGKMLDAIVAGNQPTALGVSDDGSLMATSDFLDSRIELFSVPPYEVLRAGNGGRSAVYRQELWKK